MAHLEFSNYGDHEEIQIREEPVPADALLPNRDWKEARRGTLGKCNWALTFERSIWKNSVIEDIIRGHPIRYALTASTTVPRVYLQQFWHHLNYEDGAFTTVLDHTPIRFSYEHIQQVLRLPTATSVQGRVHFDEIPDRSTILEDIHNLGYTEELTKAYKFKVMHLQGHWHILFQFINKCLTSKATGHDTATLAVLQMFHAFVFDRHYDYTLFVVNELKEAIKDKSKRSYVPYQRFLQLIIDRAMQNDEAIHDRPADDVYEALVLSHLQRKADNPNVRVRPLTLELLRYAHGRLRRVRTYLRTHHSSTIQAEPTGSTQDEISSEESGEESEGEHGSEQREVSESEREGEQGGEGDAEETETDSDVRDQQAQEFEDIAEIDRQLNLELRTKHTHERQQRLAAKQAEIEREKREKEEEERQAREAEKRRLETLARLRQAQAQRPQFPLKRRLKTIARRTPTKRLRTQREIEDAEMQHVSSEESLNLGGVGGDAEGEGAQTTTSRASQQKSTSPVDERTSPTIHSPVSLQTGVSPLHGDKPHTPPSPHSEDEGVESGRLSPHATTFPSSTVDPIHYTRTRRTHQGAFVAPGTPRSEPTDRPEVTGGGPAAGTTEPPAGAGPSGPQPEVQTGHLRDDPGFAQLKKDVEDIKATQAEMLTQVSFLVNQAKGKSTAESQQPSEPSIREDLATFQMTMSAMLEETKNFLSRKIDTVADRVSLLEETVLDLQESCRSAAQSTKKHGDDQDDDPHHPEGERSPTGPPTETRGAEETGKAKTQQETTKGTGQGGVTEEGLGTEMEPQMEPLPVSSDSETMTFDKDTFYSEPKLEPYTETELLSDPTASEAGPSSQPTMEKVWVRAVIRGRYTDIPIERPVQQDPYFTEAYYDEQAERVVENLVDKDLPEDARQDWREFTRETVHEVMRISPEPTGTTVREERKKKEYQAKKKKIEEFHDKHKLNPYLEFEMPFFFRYESLGTIPRLKLLRIDVRSRADQGRYEHLMEVSERKRKPSSSQIRRITDLRWDKCGNMKTPVLHILRKDDSSDIYGESDFDFLGYDELENLFCRVARYKPRNPIKVKARTIALEGLLRAIRRQDIVTILTDFQIALENEVLLVGLSFPRLEFPQIHMHPVYQVLKKPEHGVIFLDPENRKRFMRFEELAAFSDGTLRLVRAGMRDRLEQDDKLPTPMKMAQEEYIAVEEGMQLITIRLDLRETVRWFEVYLRLRKRSEGRFV